MDEKVGSTRTTVLPDLPPTPVSVDALAAPFDAAADLRERQLDEFAHRAGLTGRQRRNRRADPPQYTVHALDIFLGVSEIAERQRIFETGLDAGDAARYLRATTTPSSRTTQPRNYALDGR